MTDCMTPKPTFVIVMTTLIAFPSPISVTLFRRLAAGAFFILAIVAVYKAMQVSGWV